MHNLHFISTPIYIICLTALFRETSQVFKVYKYYIIAHIITNVTSEFYVTFMWLPITYLPYDVYRATGWLSQWGVSGVFQFYTLAQFIIVIGVSVLEMFHYRFHVVVLHREGNFVLKLPTYGLYVFRFFAVLHLITLTWSTIDDKTIMYQQNKKDALFKKVPDLPKELGCYSVFILATEDPILILNVVIYSILVCLGSAVGLSTVVFINIFLNSAKNLSKETKKLQRILIFSLLAQGAIHVVMIISPVVFQIYQMIFIMYDNINSMNCSLPAPWFYEFIMHNGHLLSTPIYIIALIALFREKSSVFQTYKYYIIAHIITNLTSEFYVTFMWLPVTYLPYDVYRTTGWLSQWGVSGILQFYILAQFVIVIGVSVLEMFHYRFHVVVLRPEGNFCLKLPTYGLYIFRFFAVFHLITITWSALSDQTIVYQQNKKSSLFNKVPDLPKELGCYSVFILAPEDPVLILNIVIYGILVCLGSIIGISSVVFINLFLNSAKNLSKETKRMQRVLIFSLTAQGAIHIVMILSPAFVQIYQMLFILYDNIIGVSVLEMFHYRFHVVILDREDKLVLKLPTFGLYIYRFFAVLHLITLTWSTLSDQTAIYQQNEKDVLFKKAPELPKELGCYSAFIAAPEDPILVLNVVIYSIVLCLGTAIIISTVVCINNYLNSANYMSKETKKLQKVLISSLLAQGAIHVVMIVSPVFVQIYQMIFIMYDNNFTTLMVFFVAYHGFFSTCAMIIFTKQLRVRVLRYVRCCFKQEVVPIERASQIERPTSFIAATAQ
ncbi:hypothetical protein B9Z55_025543 [Caenorhabditis nigoni]|nr:hypothetical protein B9Z55_025543 [Caenorhabditis nigoni]